MRVNEITSLREALDIRQVQGGYEIFDTETGRKAPNTRIYGSEGDAESERDRIRAATRPTTPRTDGSTVGPAQGDTDTDSNKQKKIVKVQLTSMPPWKKGAKVSDLNGVEWEEEDEDGKKTKKTGNSKQFLASLERNDPDTYKGLKAQAETTHRSVERKLNKGASASRASLFANMEGKSRFFRNVLIATELLEFLILVGSKAKYDNENFASAAGQYIVPFFVNTASIILTMWLVKFGGAAQHSIGKVLVAGRMATMGGAKFFLKLVGPNIGKNNWWRRLRKEPSKFRQHILDVLIFTVMNLGAVGFMSRLENETLFLEKWAIWDAKDLWFGAANEVFDQAISYGEEPSDGEPPNQTEIDTAIEKYKAGETQELIDRWKDAATEVENNPDADPETFFNFLEN